MGWKEQYTGGQRRWSTALGGRARRVVDARRPYGTQSKETVEGLITDSVGQRTCSDEIAIKARVGTAGTAIASLSGCGGAS